MARRKRRKTRQSRSSVNFVGSGGGSTVRDVLQDALQRCTEAYMAVAYASASGWKEIASGVSGIVGRGSAVHIITDLAAGITEPDALDAMAALGPTVARGFFRAPGSEGEIANYHPKAYGFLLDDTAVLIVGSSNLTQGGLVHNVESCLVARAPQSSQVWQSFVGWFRDLWGNGSLVHPLTPAVLNAYRESYKRGRKGLRPALVEKAIEEALRTALLGQDDATAFLAGLIAGHSRINRRRRTVTCVFTHGSTHDQDALPNGVRDIARYVSSAFDSGPDGVHAEVNPKATHRTELQLTWPRGSATFAHLSRSGLTEQAVPGWVRDVDNTVLAAFLRGVGETAAIVSQGSRDWVGRHRIKVCSGDKDPVLLRFVQTALRERFGIRTSLNRRRRDDPREHQLNVYAEDYEAVGFVSEWKAKRLAEFIEANRERADSS